MKKFLRILTIAVICLCVPLLFSGCDENESELNQQNFRVQDGYVQYTKDGNTWINLIEAEYPISEYDFRIYDGYVQWTTDGENWTNLIKTEEDVKTYTVELDYGAAYQAQALFSDHMCPIFTSDSSPKSLIVNEGEWISDLPKVFWAFEDSFKGWFIKGTERQITEYDCIAGDITLEARFDFTASGAPAGSYKDGKYIKTWQQLIDEGSIVVNDGILTYGFVEGDLKIEETVTKIEETAFDKLSITIPLTGVVIPDSVKSIEKGAFRSCGSLKNVILGRNVYIIDEWAFAGCNSLTSLTIPGNVKLINENAFLNCYNLTFVNLIMNYGETWKIYEEDVSMSQNASLLTERQVAYYLSYGYEFRNVITRGNFDYVTTPTKVILMSVINKSDVYNETIESFWDSAFTFEIADYAFMGSEKLHTVTISEDVEYIGCRAFYNCSDLTTVNFGEKTGYKWQVCENNVWRDAEASELFDLIKAGNELKRVAE